jgi:hypothetical protein
MTSAVHRRAKPWRLVIVLLLLAVTAAVLAGWTARQQESGKPFAMNSPTFELLTVPKAVPKVPKPTGACARPATAPFTPTSISMPGIIRDGNVLALPRDADNIPAVPPTSAKFTFAWDRPPGIMPGSDRGNVLLNAHTWPDGSAVGNVMLNKLDEGDTIILSGGRSELCYTVTKRIEVLASTGYVPYYDREGSPKVALIVCSGRRLGLGQWTHRTVWLAEPST